MISLHNADFNDVLPALPTHSVDTVIADPPYGKQYLPLYGHLAAHLPRLLKVGGSLLCIIPHYDLPRIVSDISQHLKWRWLNCMWQANGAHPRMAMGIEILHKPIGWWINEKWPPGRGFIKDGFVNTPPDKAHHQWQQSLSWADYCLSFVPECGTVLDPMMGTGTVGVAAVRRGCYNFIGIEKNPETFRIAKARIGGDSDPSRT